MMNGKWTLEDSPRRVLFVDFDGVLHRFSAYRTRKGIKSSHPSIKLFEYASVLNELIAPYPEVEIVLSTSWVRVLGFSRARDFLPLESLRVRVVGATFHSAFADAWAWPAIARGVQVLRYVRVHRLVNWLAVDDEADGFEEYFNHFVKCDEALGLGDMNVQSAGRDALSAQFGANDGA
jgi:hypothetical protein